MSSIDAIWLISVPILLSILAIIGFIAFKLGINLFNLVMEPIKATKGIEDIKGEIKRPKYETEEDEIKIITSFFRSIIGLSVHKKSKNTKYAYIQLFKK